MSSLARKTYRTDLRTIVLKEGVRGEVRYRDSLHLKKIVGCKMLKVFLGIGLR